MRVRIYKPSSSVTQSACGCAGGWLIEPEASGARLREPLMGWMAAEDASSCMKGRLRFASEEEAVAFARRRGWEIRVQTPAARRVVPKNYTDNFNPDRRRDGR